MTWLREQWRRDALWLCAAVVAVPYGLVTLVLYWLDVSR